MQQEEEKTGEMSLSMGLDRQVDPGVFRDTKPSVVPNPLPDIESLEIACPTDSSDSVSCASTNPIPDESPDVDQKGDVSSGDAKVPTDKVCEKGDQAPGRDLDTFKNTMLKNIEALGERLPELDNAELSALIEENVMCRHLYEKVYRILSKEKLDRINRDRYDPTSEKEE